MVRIDNLKLEGLVWNPEKEIRRTCVMSPEIRRRYSEWVEYYANLGHRVTSFPEVYQLIKAQAISLNDLFLQTSFSPIAKDESIAILTATKGTSVNAAGVKAIDSLYSIQHEGISDRKEGIYSLEWNQAMHIDEFLEKHPSLGNALFMSGTPGTEKADILEQFFCGVVYVDTTRHEPATDYIVTIAPNSIEGNGAVIWLADHRLDGTKYKAYGVRK